MFNSVVYRNQSPILMAEKIKINDKICNPGTKIIFLQNLDLLDTHTAVFFSTVPVISFQPLDTFIVENT